MKRNRPTLRIGITFGIESGHFLTTFALTFEVDLGDVLITFAITLGVDLGYFLVTLGDMFGTILGVDVGSCLGEGESYQRGPIYFIVNRDICIRRLPLLIIRSSESE